MRHLHAGMLMAASELLNANVNPTRADVEDALGGVLCRCTGYVKIVDAVCAVAETRTDEAGNGWVGARLKRVDGIAKLTGSEMFGSDQAPEGALWLRIFRSPHPRGKFAIAGIEAFRLRHGLDLVLTASDVPNNKYGIYPIGKDQPVLASGEALYRGDPVLAVAGPREIVESLRDEDLPIVWTILPAVSFAEARSECAAALHAALPDNVLVRGRVVKGNVEQAFSDVPVQAEIETETGFVEHAYIEPEAGYAMRVGDRIEVTVCTQTPVMDRDEIAHIMRTGEVGAVRVIPTATGGGFGGKLDLSVQPLVALAAWKCCRRPVRCIYSRPESLMATTKRHPSQIRARAAADAEGAPGCVRFHGRFRYRRLCLLGTDGRQSRAGACDGALSCAACARDEPRPSYE